MKFSVVFPTCDLRRFVRGPSGVLEVPGWPRPEPDRDFVRAVGSIKEDDTWGIDGWVSERYFCSATKAVRFHDFPTLQITPPKNSSPRRRHLQIKIARKSYFFDGRAVAKLEISFQPATPLQISQAPIPISDFIKYIVELDVALPAQVRQQISADNKFEYEDMAAAGPTISRFLTAATSTKEGLKDYENNKKLLKPGKPILFFDIEDDDPIELDEGFRSATTEYPWHIDLFHSRRRILYRSDVPIWAMKRRPGLQKRFGNAARLYLIRLHCEHECLRAVLDAIQRGEIAPERKSAESNFLQEYLNEATRNIYALEKKFKPLVDITHGTSDSIESIELLARASLDHMQAGEKYALEHRLKAISIRRNIEIKSLKYLDDDEAAAKIIFINQGTLTMVDQKQSVVNSSNVSLNQAGRDAHVRLENSFSAVQGSSAKSEIAQHLAEIKSFIECAINSGHLTDPDNVARDFQELTNEISSTSPRKEKVESSGNFILNGIKSVSDAAKPVAEAINSILKLMS